MTLVGVTACNNSDSHEHMQKITSQHGDIYMDDKEVHVTDEHLVSIKPKLYQPGLTLFGKLKPLKKTIIVSPQRVHIEQIFVHTGEQVAKGDTLFSYTPAPIKPKTPTLIDNIAPTSEDLKQLNIADNDNTKTTSQRLPDSERKTSELNHKKDTGSKVDVIKVDNEQISDAIATDHTTNNAISNTEDNSENSTETNSTANTVNAETDEQTTKGKIEETKIIQAPFAGEVRELYYSNLHHDSGHNFNPLDRHLEKSVVNKDTPLMKLETTNDLYFVSIFPEFTRSKLSIGQHVNFVAQQVNNSSTSISEVEQANNSNNPNHKPSNETLTTDDLKLTGQISDIQPINDYEIQVTVNVLTDENHDRPIPLTPGVLVQGRVDYGQMEVGTLVDETGVFETPKSNLSIFKLPDAHVSAPMDAYVWIVGHDQKIRRLSVYVISYDINTKQYLVSDVPNEVMIILADLPKQAEGKILKIQ